MVKNLSVFFPLYNEEGNVKEDVVRAVKVLEKLKLDYEILLINDGSSDKTGQIADQIAQGNPNVRAIHHQKNLGYGEALKSGFYNAKFDTIVYTDGDGQFDFSEIYKFLEKINDSDLIVGYRIKRRDPFFRILFKKGWKLSLLTFFGLTLKDVDCGFKMVKRKVLEKIPILESQRGAMINAELAIKAKKYGFKVSEVGVTHYPRLSGKPTGANIRVIFKSFIDLLRLWWKLKDEKHLFLILVFILALASFLRFYRISEYMTFLGDEGRDAIVVKNMLVNHHFPLIGPPTSVGNIYLGPLYYYMMSVSMVPFGLNPAAAVGMNALIGVLTVGLIYYLGKVWFGRVAALISAYLYAISPVTIIYSRSSWNPNPTPFFSLLSVLGLYKAHTSKNYKWLILTGVAAASALQMHYLALILLPVLLIGWIKELILQRQDKGKFFWKGTILALAGFFLIMSPLLIFDLKHDFLNYKAITKFFETKESIGFNILDTINRMVPTYSHNLVGRYLTGENPILTALISILILIPIFYTGIRIYKNRPYNYGIWMLNNWLLLGILGLTLYKNDIYDHYLNFLNPVPFLLLGSIYSVKIFQTPQVRLMFKVLIILLLLSLTIINLQKNPLIYPPNNQLKRTQDITKFIIEKLNGKDFNFALLAQKNYDSAYQFYLDQYGHQPKQLPFEKTNQLFVVCEDQVCDPIYSPKYEIAAFGWTLVEKMWNVEGLKVYKLIQNPQEFK